MEKYAHSSREWPILTDVKGVKENKSSISCYECKEKDQPKWVSLHCFPYYNFYYLIIIKKIASKIFVLGFSEEFGYSSFFLVLNIF